MIAALGLTGIEEVFEVGTGYGYQTALLALLAARVVSIDIWPDLAAQARRNLAAQGLRNVVVPAWRKQRRPGRRPVAQLLTHVALLLLPLLPSRSASMAAIEDEPVPVNLHRARVVGGVAIDHIDTAIDQPPGKADLVPVHAIPPVGSPVDRHDDDITVTAGRFSGLIR